MISEPVLHNLVALVQTESSSERADGRRPRRQRGMLARQWERTGNPAAMPAYYAAVDDCLTLTPLEARAVFCVGAEGYNAGFREASEAFEAALIDSLVGLASMGQYRQIEGVWLAHRYIGVRIDHQLVIDRLLVEYGETASTGYANFALLSEAAQQGVPVVLPADGAKH